MYDYNSIIQFALNMSLYKIVSGMPFYLPFENHEYTNVNRSHTGTYIYIFIYVHTTVYRRYTFCISRIHHHFGYDTPFHIPLVYLKDTIGR